MDDTTVASLSEVNSFIDTLGVRNTPINSDILFEKAKKLSETNSMLVGVAGNAISLFAMFVLKEILEQQALNPLTNLESIITISNTIANLNSNLTIYSLARP